MEKQYIDRQLRWQHAAAAEDAADVDDGVVGAGSVVDDS